MNGILIFYINFPDDTDQQIVVNLLKQINKPVFDKIIAETGYEIAFFPTKNEACRIEKIDLDKPFPRFSPNNVDLATLGRPRRQKKEEIKVEKE